MATLDFVPSVEGNFRRDSMSAILNRFSTSNDWS